VRPLFFVFRTFDCHTYGKLGVGVPPVADSLVLLANSFIICRVEKSLRLCLAGLRIRCFDPIAEASDCRSIFRVRKMARATPLDSAVTETGAGSTWTPHKEREGYPGAAEFCSPPKRNHSSYPSITEASTPTQLYFDLLFGTLAHFPITDLCSLNLCSLR